MVTTAEGIADRFKRITRQGAGDIHRHLTGENNRTGPTAADQFAEADLVVVRDLALDLVDSHFTGSLFVQQIAQQTLYGTQIQLAVDQIIIARNTGQRTFHPPHVAGDALGQKVHDLIVQFDLHGRGLVPEDGYPGLEIGCLDISH